MDARIEITDHYAFQKPDHPDRTILILNVNPLAPAHAAEFRSDAVYETLVDTNGDAKPDIVFSTCFRPKTIRATNSQRFSGAILPVSDPRATLPYPSPSTRQSL